MNVKDRAFLVDAMRKLNDSNASAYEFTTNGANVNRIIAIVLKNGEAHVHKEIDLLKKALNKTTHKATK